MLTNGTIQQETAMALDYHMTLTGSKCMLSVITVDYKQLKLNTSNYVSMFALNYKSRMFAVVTE